MVVKEKKKEFTSEDLGKALLRNLVNTPTDNLNDIKNLHKSIRYSTDRKIFNEYVEIQRYLTSFILDYQTEVRRLGILYLEIYRYWQNLVDAEHAYEALNCQPRIMTRQAYEKLLNENRKELEQGGFSLLEIFQYELKNYINDYKNRIETPYDEIFNILKDQPVDFDMRSSYSHSFYASDNKFMFLDSWFNSYDSVNDFANEKIAKFIVRDYEVLIKAMLKKYSELKGLKYLGNLPKSRYNDKNLINFVKAMKLNILGARQTYENPLLKLESGDYLWYGVAVIENLTIFTEEKITNNFYKYDIDSKLFAYLSENFINNYEIIHSIVEIKDQLKYSLKRINGFIYAFYKFSDITGVSELKELNISKGHNTLKSLNKLFDVESTIKRYNLLSNEKPAEELRRIVKEIFTTNFTEKDLFINEQERKEANKIIVNSHSKSEAVRLLGNYLTGLQP